MTEFVKNTYDHRKERRLKIPRWTTVPIIGEPKIIFFIGPNPEQTRALTRITSQMTNYFAAQGHRVVYYGFKNYPNTRFVDPRIEILDDLVEKDFIKHIERVNPDVLYIFNGDPPSMNIQV